MTEEQKNVIDTVVNIVQLFAIIGGALWAYYRFIREGVHRRKMQFSINCKFLGPHHGVYLAQFILIASNKGFVVHRFPSIKLRVRGIKNDDELIPWKGMEPRLLFGTELFESEVIHKNYNYIFVEPGVEQSISFVTSIPDSYKFVIARAEFNYDESNAHSAESVFEVIRSTV